MHSLNPPPIADVLWKGIGQSDCARYCRTRPGIRAIWEGIWETQELLCCFGSMGCFRGAEHAVKFDRDWLHTDQSLAVVPRTGFSLQGILNLLPCMEPNDHGSFVFIEKSHRRLLERRQQGLDTFFDQMRNGQCELPKVPLHPFYAAAQDGSEPALALALPARAFLVFDSVTTHATHAPTTKTITGQVGNET